MPLQDPGTCLAQIILHNYSGGDSISAFYYLLRILKRLQTFFEWQAVMETGDPYDFIAFRHRPLASGCRDPCIVTASRDAAR